MKIEFRAWDKEKNIFTNFIIADNMIKFMDKYIGIWHRDDKQERFVLMKSTGLEDKNGRKIYEGDIVKAISFARWVGIIKYLPEKAAFVLWDSEDMPHRDDYVFLSQFEDGFEILGNIHENSYKDIYKKYMEM